MERAMHPLTWRCGAYEFLLARTLVMGIVNVTPDSFSDGGDHAGTEAAITHGRRLVAEGAAILDVGGESTRPGSEPVSVDEELARVVPVVRALAADRIPVSIDTRHAEVAAACVAEGACIINDVSGFRDPAMVEVAVGSGCGLVAMHMLGEPKTMQAEPRYEDVTREVGAYLLDVAMRLESAGVDPERIALDPGIGFGKTLEHNLTLLRDTADFVAQGYPVLIGASRKRFIGELTGVEDPKERLGGSVATALWVASRGAAVVRVHDVAQTVQALAVADALGA